MSKPQGSLSAVVVSGGKQYRVSPGDQVLVDRIASAPGSSVKLERVLLFQDGDTLAFGKPVVEGVHVEAKVLAHRRGPRIEVLRYKSKKHVRVHRGARADLTALEILTVGGKGLEVAEPKKVKADKKVKAEKRKAAGVAAVKEPEAKAGPVDDARTKASPSPSRSKKARGESR